MHGFQPTASCATLVEGRRTTGDVVRIGGRVRRTADRGTVLADGRVFLPIYFVPGREVVLPEAAWVGVEGRWNAARGCVEEAQVLYVQPACLSPIEASFLGLPEADFVCDPERLAAVEDRARLLQWVRWFLDAHGFLEVQTPFLRVAPEIAFLQQYETRAFDGRTLYLRTDPEEYLKRYLTAGLDAVYEISTNVRGDRPDADRLQEFTSLECYKRFWTFGDVVTTCGELVAGALTALRGATMTCLHGREVDLTPPIAVRAFGELVLQYTGIELTRYPTAASLAEAVCQLGWQGQNEAPFGGFRRMWLEWLFEYRVVPQIDRATFVVDFPSQLALSYRTDPESANVCFRGELILPGGLELCHVYENLTDAVALRTQYEERLAYRVAGGFQSVAIDEGLMSSLELGMPPMGGMAVGLDRLLLLIRGKGIVGDGLLFPREGFTNGVE